jgi:putative tricarboxylic transport membrane protein
VTLAFGFVGYLMIKADLPRAPLVLALVLAPLMESSLRQSMMMSEGTLNIFFERPISIILVIAVVLSLAWPVVRAVRSGRAEHASVRDSQAVDSV